jgi:hypothetical protein
MFEGHSADMGAGKFLLVSMAGRAEGLACADLGARTTIGASGNLKHFLIKSLTISGNSKHFSFLCFFSRRQSNPVKEEKRLLIVATTFCLQGQHTHFARTNKECKPQTILLIGEACSRFTVVCVVLQWWWCAPGVGGGGITVCILQARVLL